MENRLNPISTRAALELTDDNLRCTVKEYSKWVEKALGISELSGLGFKLARRLRRLNFRRDQAEDQVAQAISESRVFR